MHQKFKETLAKYLPEHTVDQVANYVVQHKIQLKITRSRNTKLGDYRPPGRIKAHRITINGDIDPFYFYLVFLHELAHLLVWTKYQNRVSPHGKQWKEEFSSLLQQALYNDFFTAPLKELVRNFSFKVKATFAADKNLFKFLNGTEQSIMLEDIPDNSYFIATNGRLFVKETRLRSRYRCYCLNNKRRYLFHPMASIQPVDKNNLPLIQQ
jgi:SprT protein